MKIRRILCCCTALLLLVLTLAACTGGGETGTSSAPVSTSSAESQPNAEKSIEDYVEKKDYGGRTFTILSPRMNADNKSETEYVKTSMRTIMRARSWLPASMTPSRRATISWRNTSTSRSSSSVCMRPRVRAARC